MALTSGQVMDRIHQINMDMLLAVDGICRRHGIEYFLAGGALIGAMRHRDFIPWDNDVDLVIKRTEFERLIPHLRAELDPELYELVMPEDYGEKYFDMVPRVNYKKADILMDPAYSAYYEHRVDKIVLDFFFMDKVPSDIRGKLQVMKLEMLYGLLNAKRYQLETKNYEGIMKLAGIVLYAAGKCFRTETLRKAVLKTAVKYNGRDDVKTLRVTNDTIESFGLEFPEAYYASTIDVQLGEHLVKAPAEPDKILRIHYGDYMQLPPEEKRIPHFGFNQVTTDSFVFHD